MKLFTPTTVRTQAYARPANLDLHHPEGYWAIQIDGDTILDSLSPLPDSLNLWAKAMFVWQSHTNITGGSMRIKEASIIRKPDSNATVLMIDGYLMDARLATPSSLDYSPNLSTANVHGVYADWEDFLYHGSCTKRIEAVTQDLLDHINKVLDHQAQIDALKASFRR